jgi:hypothetical protein
MTLLPELRRREESLSVSVRETREPPRTQFVKETVTLRSEFLDEGMFVNGEVLCDVQHCRWLMALQ